MRPVGRLTLLVLAIALAPWCAGSASGAGRTPAVPGPTPAAAGRLVPLRNGMQLLLAPDTMATTVDVSVWSRAGSAREPAGQVGISRLLERLLLAGGGTPEGAGLGRRIAEIGGQAGARTLSDFACYYETVPAGSLDLAVELEAGRIRALSGEAASLADAVRAAGEEARRQAATQPWGPALQAFYGLAWGTHPYHRLAIGTDEDLSRITPADCQGYHAAAFAPNELLVTITGRFDAAAAQAAAKRWLEPIARRPRLPDVPAPAVQAAPRSGVERLDVPLDLVVVGWKVPGRAAAETPALRLLARLFAGDPASRPQSVLLADSVGCLSVQAMLDSRRQGGLLYVMAVLKPGADSALVQRALLAELERFAREPAEAADLERARRAEEMSTLLGWQTPRGCAEALGSAQLVDGDWRLAASRYDDLQRLTAADVQRVAARVLVPAGRTLLWVSTTRPSRTTPSTTQRRR